MAEESKEYACTCDMEMPQKVIEQLKPALSAQGTPDALIDIFSGIKTLALGTIISKYPQTILKNALLEDNPGEFTLDFITYRADGRFLEIAESPGLSAPLLATVKKKYSI